MFGGSDHLLCTPSNEQNEFKRHVNQIRDSEVSTILSVAWVTWRHCSPDSGLQNNPLDFKIRSFSNIKNWIARHTKRSFEISETLIRSPVGYFPSIRMFGRLAAKKKHSCDETSLLLRELLRKKFLWKKFFWNLPFKSSEFPPFYEQILPLIACKSGYSLLQ